MLLPIFLILFEICAINSVEVLNYDMNLVFRIILNGDIERYQCIECEFIKSVLAVFLDYIAENQIECEILKHRTTAIKVPS